MYSRIVLDQFKIPDLNGGKDSVELSKVTKNYSYNRQ